MRDKRAIPSASRLPAALAAIGQTEMEPNVLYPARCAYCDFVGAVNWDLRPGQERGWVQFVDLELDHIWPEHLGGTGDPDNIALACRDCNRSKGHKTLSEWLCAR